MMHRWLGVFALVTPLFAFAQASTGTGGELAAR